MSDYNDWALSRWWCKHHAFVIHLEPKQALNLHSYLELQSTLLRPEERHI